MSRKKDKSKESIKRMAHMLEKIDDLGMDVDEFRHKPDSEIQLLWKSIYGKTLGTKRVGSTIIYTTVKGYKRVADQIAVNYNTLIKNQNKNIVKLEDKRLDIHIELKNGYQNKTKAEKKVLEKRIIKTDKQIQALERKIQKYKTDDIKQRKQVLKTTGKSIDAQMMNFKATIAKNRLRLRVHRVKLTNKIFEDIVNGLIIKYNMDRREALEHARLIAKIPKDEVGMFDNDYITPRGLKIPHKVIDYYRKNSPSVLSI